MFHAVAMLFLVALATAAHAQTRIYINNSAELFKPLPQGSWDDTTPNQGVLHFPCRITPGGSFATVANTEQSTDDGHRILVVTCVSDALAFDQMIGGPGSSVSWVLGTAEANSIQDNYWRAHMWVSRGSTDDIRGVLLEEYEESATTAPGNEWPAAHAKGWANYGMRTPLEELPVAARAGDRLIIEIGATLHRNSSAGYASTLWIGGAGARDLQPAGDETSAPGWFELSQDIFFAPADPNAPPTTAAPTPTATAASAPASTPTPTFIANQPNGSNLSVDSTLDLAGGLGNCSLDSGSTGSCTLRAAVQTANFLPGPTTVNLPDGIYELSLGQLAVTGDLLVRGNSGDSTAVVIKLVGRSTSRAFAVVPTASLTLKDLTILDYRNELDTALEGGCVYNLGTLALDNTVLHHCDNARALSSGDLAKGGAVYNAGVLFSRNGTKFHTGVSNWGACLFNARFAAAHLSDTTFLNCHTLGMDVLEPAHQGDTAGGGAGIFNAGSVDADRASFIYCRARLGLGGGAILNGDQRGDDGLGSGGTITLNNATFSRNRCRRCEGGAITAYGGTINAKLTTIAATQSAFLSGIILRDGAVLNADRMIIEGHNISNPPSGFDVCFLDESSQVNVVGAAPSMDDSLDITPPRNTCPGFTPANLCLMSDSDYGGLVETVRLNNSTTCTSAAIDAGGATCDEAVDARGLPRPAGFGCDLGSFEVQP